MKLRLNCMECFQQQGQPSFEFQLVEVRDDGLYESKCNKGHTTLTAIQEQKFELLFDFGAMALLDGYPREAVTSFAASLERFYEFYVFVTCLKHGLDENSIKQTWTHVSNQSERQFGAYLFIYLIDHNGEVPPVIDNMRPEIKGVSKGNTKTWKEFRNAVVHKGYIPSYLEAVVYGNIVYAHINELIFDLKERSQDFVQKATFHHLSRAHQSSSARVVSTMSISTIISLTRRNDPQDTFENALEKLKVRMHYEKNG